MAWTWGTNRVGRLKGQYNGDTKVNTIEGISGNAILRSPAETVANVNVILDLAGKTLVVSEKLVYDHSEGAVENE